MRSGKQLIADSKQFSSENIFRSWLELLSTVALTVAALVVGFSNSVPLIVRIICCVLTGLLYIRLFVIYHDYEHRAILKDSRIAHWIMAFIGIYLLAPENIWKRSHDHHHNHNSKLTLS